MQKTLTPWGWWEVLLDESYTKVKRILVNPFHRLSYQKHFKRSEYWTVVNGTATVTLDDVQIQLQEGQSLHIPQGSFHRIANTLNIPLILIEVQYGTYFGEDDIIRVSDDYGRA
ncbi:phosphomannose isomerase type II C-terminal cupin domain [bacterium]|jgi:mannose-6-phosphate isomerase|nr:phosphomannose isomerase type II C-terminal cupin domain [bacterium]